MWMKKTTLVSLSVVALFAGLVWVASGNLPGMVSVVVIVLPVVLCGLSLAWGE